jgi:hypothetical protein
MNILNDLYTKYKNELKISSHFYNDPYSSSISNIIKSINKNYGEEEEEEEDNSMEDEKYEKKEGDYNVVFNIQHILDKIYKNSLESPLFSKLVSEKDIEHNKMMNKCNSIWKEKLTPSANNAGKIIETSKSIGDKGGVIPFLIIRRINNRLG